MTLDEIRKETQAYKNMPKLERVVFHDYLVLDFSKFCEKQLTKQKIYDIIRVLKQKIKLCTRKT